MMGHLSKWTFRWVLWPRRDQLVASRAWDATRKMFDQLEADWSETIIHQNQDSVYTSNRWLDQLLENCVPLSYSMNGTKGNTYVDSFNGHCKQPIESPLLGADLSPKVKGVTQKQVKKWNQDRRHSNLGKIVPGTYIGNRREGELIDHLSESSTIQTRYDP